MAFRAGWPTAGETNLVLAAQRVLADSDRFSLTADAAEEWESINARPPRELAGLHRLMERPAPFAGGDDTDDFTGRFSRT